MVHNSIHVDAVGSENLKCIYRYIRAFFTMVALLGTRQQHLLGSTLTLPKIHDHLPPPSPDYFVSLGLSACVHRHLS